MSELNRDNEELLERICEEGDEVFRKEWDSGGPGAGAGCEWVCHWKGWFAAASLDDCDSGPFSTLDAALKSNDLLTVTSATTAIWCSLLSASDIARRLRSGEEGLWIRINGDWWVCEKGRFAKASIAKG